MLCRNAHIGHDEFRPVKDMSINALQDKARPFEVISTYEKGTINIAGAEFLNVCNSARRIESLCNGKKIGQVSTSLIDILE